MSEAPIDPRLIPSSKNGYDWSAYDERVTTIHLGTPGSNETLSISLPPDLATRFPHLTHLRLWNVDVTELPPLPVGLKGLELRKCAALKNLPVLPQTLETLDLGGCRSLANFPKQGLPALRRLHLDECSHLPDNRLNGFLEDCAHLEEFTCEGCTQLKSLCLPQQTANVEDRSGQLQRIVLSGCDALTELPELAGYPWLRHLNLNGCAALRHLPELPMSTSAEKPPLGPGLQYLVAYGCQRMRSYGHHRLDLRAVHLSRSKEDNVTPMIRTLHDLGTDAGELVMAKLLLLGSGRCGKTTIAKALQWYEKQDAERLSHVELNPATAQTSTVRIQFWQWQTAFEMNGSGKNGTAHLWDFAGQEVYHNTHRLFASQGAVFIIATTSPEEHAQRVERELAQIKKPILKDAHKTENEYRELKYWLDYLRNALGLEHPGDLAGPQSKVSVLIVHTGAGDAGSVKTYLARQAGPYAELVRSGDLPVHLYNWNNKTAETDFAQTRVWAQRALGKSADELGVRGPRLFQRLSERCGELLERDLKAPEQPVLGFVQAWQPLVAEAVGTGNVSLPADRLPEVAAESARYLHNCGQIFWLRKHLETQGEIIINQPWSCRAIYALCDPAHPSTLAKVSGGLFPEEKLKEAVASACGKDYTTQSGDYQQLFLDLLDKCDICVRAGRDGWMAVQAELLPEFDVEVKAALEQEWDAVALLEPGVSSNHSFSLFGTEKILLGNSDFRSLLAWLARHGDGDLGKKLLAAEDDPETGIERGDGGSRVHDRYSFPTQYRVWQDGIQITLRRCRSGGEHLIGGESETQVTALLRVEWRNASAAGAEDKHEFEGGLFIQFLTPDEDRYAPRLKQMLFGGNGPLSFFKDKLVETDQRPFQDSIEKWALRGSGASAWSKPRSESPPTGTPFDIAVSYRSNDRELVERMCSALRLTGWRVYNYDTDLDFKPEHGGSRLTEIYDYLKYAKLLIVVASDAYFDVPVYDPTGRNQNLYCPVELAEAVLAWEGYSRDEKERHGLEVDKRGAKRFLWVTSSAAGLTPGKISERVAPLLTQYHQNVVLKRAPKPEDERSTPVVDIDKRERDSITKANDASIVQFLNAVGRDEKNCLTIKEAKPDLFAELLGRVSQALA